MEKFQKVTIGFVIQHFENMSDGKFRCTAQEFIAGESEYETTEGEPLVSMPDYEYQPYDMVIKGHPHSA